MDFSTQYEIYWTFRPSPKFDVNFNCRLHFWQQSEIAEKVHTSGNKHVIFEKAYTSDNIFCKRK
mgnify:CR=1 FL=1